MYIYIIYTRESVELKRAYTCIKYNNIAKRSSAGDMAECSSSHTRVKAVRSIAPSLPKLPTLLSVNTLYRVRLCYTHTHTLLLLLTTCVPYTHIRSPRSGGLDTRKTSTYRENVLAGTSKNEREHVPFNKHDFFVHLFAFAVPKSIHSTTVSSSARSQIILNVLWILNLSTTRYFASWRIKSPSSFHIHHDLMTSIFLGRHLIIDSTAFELQNTGYSHVAH